MSNKANNQLMDADRRMRQLSPNKGMTGKDEKQICVTLIRGYEKFNTRAHHNYETWSDGYLVEAFRGNAVIASAEAEDLDDALDLLEKRIPG